MLNNKKVIIREKIFNSIVGETNVENIPKIKQAGLMVAQNNRSPIAPRGPINNSFIQCFQILNFSLRCHFFQADRDTQSIGSKIGMGIEKMQVPD